LQADRRQELFGSQSLRSASRLS